MERSTSSSVVVALHTEIRMQPAAPPRRAAEPACAVALHGVDDRVGAGVVAEAGEHLVEHDVVGDLGTTVGEAVGEAAGQHGSSARRARRCLSEPSWRIAAHVANPRARRDDSRVRSPTLATVAPAPTRYGAV